MSSPGGSSSSRVRTCSESSEGELGGVRPSLGGVSYDVDGKFSFSQVGLLVLILGFFAVNLIFFQVMKSKLMGQMKTTVDENGKFDYIRLTWTQCHQGGMTWTGASMPCPRGGMPQQGLALSSGLTMCIYLYFNKKHLSVCISFDLLGSKIKS